MATTFFQTLVYSGLGTISITMPVAGSCFFEGKLSLPTIVGGASPSSVVVTINQNGTPVYTGTAGATGFRADFICALNDVITIVLSSAAAVDNTLNAIKTTIEIGQGI